MKTIQEIIIGSAVFLVIDRTVRLISAHVTSKGDRRVQEVSLYIELFTLILTILVAWKLFG